MVETVFTALDGEGYNDRNKHNYNLLVAVCLDKSGQRILVPSNNPNRLRSAEIFQFLDTLPLYKGATFVGFFLNYDITKWIEDLSEEQKLELYHTTHTRYDNPYLAGSYWNLTFIPRKMFRCELYNSRNYKLTAHTIYDVFGFFQKSFVRALDDWQIIEHTDFIERMKEKRGSFKREDLKNIIPYTIAECENLCRLMNKVNASLIKNDIHLKKWMGAGSIAEYILKVNRCEKYLNDRKFYTNRTFYNASLGAYFGGRFEICKLGIITKTHKYDINSAYPHALSTIPNFQNCRIKFTREYNSSPYSIWYISYTLYTKDSDKLPFIGPLPFRTKTGSICYPPNNHHGVWVHQVELKAVLRHYDKSRFRIHYGYIITPMGNKQCFSFINDLAAKRLALKIINDLSNIVLKLGLNSLYGKTVQSQTTSEWRPPFLNYYVGGLITAITRARLLDLAFTCGSNGSGIIQFATDGIFSTIQSSEIKSSSTQFGGWEYDLITEPICYVQPGVYFSEKPLDITSKDYKRRTRGFNVTAINGKAVFNAWRLYGTNASLKATGKRFVGIGSCIVYNSFRNYGRFIKEVRTLTFRPPVTKNVLLQPLNSAGETDYMPILGPSRQEQLKDKEYELLVCGQFSWDDFDYPSLPYVPHKMRDVESLDVNAKNLAIANMMAFEQPDDIVEEWEV